MFLTGTDEHSQKIETGRGGRHDRCPKQFVDQIVEGEKGILDLRKLMNISNDWFIRTTDDYPLRRRAKIFRKMYDNGDIYKGAYKGEMLHALRGFWTEPAGGRQVPRLRPRGTRRGGGRPTSSG